MGALFLTGCGTASDTVTAIEKVPELKLALSQVDNSLAHRQYAAARRSLTKLISDTRAAQRAGDLSAASAARIIDAARVLLAKLTPPKAKPTQQPEERTFTPTPSASPTKTLSAKPTPSVKPTPTPTPTPTAPTTSATPDPTPTETPTPDAGGGGSTTAP